MKTDKQITMHFGGGCLYLKCHKCGKEVGHAEVKFPGTPEQQKEPRKKLAFGYSSIFYLHCLDMAPMLPCSMKMPNPHSETWEYMTDEAMHERFRDAVMLSVDLETWKKILETEHELRTKIVKE